MTYRPDDIVKSCPRLESGLRFGPDGIRACILGAFAAPLYWPSEEAAGLRITKEMILEKRRWLFELLNDAQSDVDIDCRHCQMVRAKRYADVDFTKLGQIDHAATTVCNLRCNFCGFTQQDLFIKKQYDELAILREFSAEDAEWDSVVDFNGGEPSLLPNVEEHLAYFASRRIRVRFMTNSVKFHPAVYAGLAEGSIQWVCTSVDAGTPSTYLRIKQRDAYLQVLENLARYAHAGSQGGGRLAMKYIFCHDNCGDDDIAGFVYAALAIRPHQVWLTFDFSVLQGVRADSEDFGGYDFSVDIAAYAKMFVLFQKHGVTPVHYTTGHLALVSRQGKVLMDRVMKEIEALSPSSTPPELILKNVRAEGAAEVPPTATFEMDPLRLSPPGQAFEPWSLRGQRVLLTPPCPLSISMLDDPQLREAELLGFLDRDRLVQGKSIQGLMIHGYEAIADLDPDLILVLAPEQHRADIVRQLLPHTREASRIVVLDRSWKGGRP